MKKITYHLIGVIITIVTLVANWCVFFAFSGMIKTIGNEEIGMISSYIIIGIPIIISLVTVAFMFISRKTYLKGDYLNDKNILIGCVFINLISITFVVYLFLYFSNSITMDIFGFLSYLIIACFYFLSLLCAFATSGKILGIRLKKLQGNILLSRKINLITAILLSFVNTISLIASFFIANWISLLLSFLLGLSTIILSIIFTCKNNE